MLLINENIMIVATILNVLSCLLNVYGIYFRNKV